MYKKLLLGLLACSLATVLFAACAIRDSAGLSNGPTVHMGNADFIQHTVTIKKGDAINLVDDAPSPHIIKNGSWVNNSQKPAQESGAPTLDLNFNGNDTIATPTFTTAGTFHLFCTIHPGMNLTVTVQ